MKATRSKTLQGLIAASILATVPPASAQQVTGKLGSPSATTSIPGDQLPPPAPPFGGKIERNALESTPWWAPRIVPPTGAPNILLIMTDDQGFGLPSTFGGVVPTPALDRIAKNGLTYTNFHSTAVCSATRAALITGRNHHSMGFGTVAETSTGFPGYNSIMTRDKATIGKVLKDNGYRTSWFGKDHNTPDFQSSQAGPFDQWPTGMGFDYFYGFVGGDTNQWQPNLFRNTTAIYPFEGKPEWNLTTAQADEAIDWMKRIDALNPKQPFLVYYAPGGTHAPHHPTKEWIEKISAMHLFDDGWNKLRDTIFANQKKLGVIPPDAKLTPWPTDMLKNWDTCTANEKKMFIRQVEVFAAYAAYTDHETGRVIQAVEDMGKLDNTLIMFISGDNGNSAEGTMLGTPNETAAVQGVEVPIAVQLEKYYDEWGSDMTYPHMAIPWTWAFSTPFSWTKMVASHFGGTKQGMAISWPARIKDVGSVRWQFHHVIDVVPTLLEAAGIPHPKVVDGLEQKPIEGVSMLYTFDKANADLPSTHKTQYFEMVGDHAIYHEGWIASSKVVSPPWDNSGAAQSDPAGYPWELYNMEEDWTQFKDVAAENPDKLKEMETLFWQEAEKYQVLPLNAAKFTRLVEPRPNLTAGRSIFNYSGKMIGTPNGDAPSVLAASYNIKAEVVIPEGGAEGMIITQGGRFGGYGFYLVKGKPTYTWNMLDLERVKWQSPDALTPGKHVLEFDFAYDGMGAATLAFNSVSGLGRSGTGVLKVDGKEIQTIKMPKTIPLTLQWDENFDVGADTLTGVDDSDYQTPFDFTGELTKVSLTINRPKLTPEDMKKLEDAMHKNPAEE